MLQHGLLVVCLRQGLLFVELADPFKLRFGVGQLGAGDFETGFRLVERILEHALVDPRQQRAGVDGVAGVDVEFEDLA